MIKKVLFSICLATMMQVAQAQTQEFPLYEGKVPNTKPHKNTESSATDANGILRISEVSIPSITVYPAPKETANGTAVIVFPGGGYRILAASHEGSDVAKELNKIGVTAFVLKYRIPDSTKQVDRTIAPLQDAQQALRFVRSKAESFGVNPNRVGILGFSAGGHLAATTATHFAQPVGELVDKSNVRPDFAVLLYPVITMKPFGHRGSQEQLIGKNPSESLVALYSNELQVTPQTPPCFLVHAQDDGGVPVQNSLRFYDALVEKKVPAELHIYPKGGHGFGLNNKTTPDKWFERLKSWMDSNGWLKK